MNSTGKMDEITIAGTGVRVIYIVIVYPFLAMLGYLISLAGGGSHPPNNEPVLFGAALIAFAIYRAIRVAIAVLIRNSQANLLEDGKK